MHYTEEAQQAFAEFIRKQRLAYSERHGRTYYPYQLADVIGLRRHVYYSIENGMVPDAFRAMDLFILAKGLGFALEDAAAVLGFPLKE